MIDDQARASFLSDPTPTVTISGNQIILHKELNGYPNYGVADRAADILFSGETGTWHFTLPAGISLASIREPFFRVSIVADDHGSGISPYTYSVATNTTTVAPNESGLFYGTPNGGPVFTDWVQRDYGVSITGFANTITIQNTWPHPGDGNWIGIDWIELQMTTPEPSSLAIVVTSAIAVGASVLWRCRRKRN
jgi:hypothetical protein